MSHPVQIVARCGPTVGLGHLMRCLSLARALRAKGASVCFRLPDDPRGREIVSEAGFQVAAWTPPPLGSLVVLDGYDLDPDFVARCRRNATLLLCNDDLRRVPTQADLVVNPEPTVRPTDYPEGLRAGLLLGPRYVCLRPEIRAAREAPARPRNGALFMLGGGARPEVAAALVQVAGDLVEEGLVARAWVLGGAYEESAVESLPGVTVIAFHPRPWELMAESAVALSAGGQSLYELACMGVPTVAYRLTPDQTYNLEGLAAEGALAETAAATEEHFVESAARDLRGLLKDAHRMAAMAAAGRSLVDGLGAERIAEALLGSGG